MDVSVNPLALLPSARGRNTIPSASSWPGKGSRIIISTRGGTAAPTRNGAGNGTKRKGRHKQDKQHTEESSRVKVLSSSRVNWAHLLLLGGDDGHSAAAVLASGTARGRIFTRTHTHHTHTDALTLLSISLYLFLSSSLSLSSLFSFWWLKSILRAVHDRRERNKRRSMIPDWWIPSLLRVAVRLILSDGTTRTSTDASCPVVCKPFLFFIRDSISRAEDIHWQKRMRNLVCKRVGRYNMRINFDWSLDGKELICTRRRLALVTFRLQLPSGLKKKQTYHDIVMNR